MVAPRRTLVTRTQAARRARRAAISARSAQVRRMDRLGFVTVAEAARRVGLSVPRIYQLLSGPLEGAREGAGRYVRRASLKRLFPRVYRERP